MVTSRELVDNSNSKLLIELDGKLMVTCNGGDTSKVAVGQLATFRGNFVRRSGNVSFDESTFLMIMLIQVPAIIARITRGNRHCNGGERVSSYTYTADGRSRPSPSSMTDTGNQVTRWVYGTTLADSGWPARTCSGPRSTR